MKKLLLSLGTIAAIVAPVTTIIACGKGHDENPTTPDITHVVSSISKKTKVELKKVILNLTPIAIGDKEVENLEIRQSEVMDQLGLKIVPKGDVGWTMTYTWDAKNLVLISVDVNRTTKQKTTIVTNVIPGKMIVDDKIKGAVTVVAGGVNGSGTLTFNNPTGATISVANNGSLSNGDVILNVVYDKGYVGSDTVKYTIEGLTTAMIDKEDIIAAVTLTGNQGSGTLTFADLEGVIFISVDNNGLLSNGNVDLTVDYAEGYDGDKTISYEIRGLKIAINPKFTHLVNQTIANGATSLAKVDPLPNGVASISLGGEIVAAGEEKEIIITITYTEGYTGPSEVKENVIGGSKTVVSTFDELVTSTNDSTMGGTTLTQIDTLPEGVESVVISPTSVGKGVTQEVVVAVTYTNGHTGASEVKKMVTGAPISIAPTFDELVTSTPDLVNGGTTLTQIDTLPEGVESVVISPTSVGKGVTQEVKAIITYATGYDGNARITQDVTGALMTIAPTFDELVTSTPDLVNGGTTLTQTDNLPEGVESVVIVPTFVDKGVTKEVLVTVTYAAGYTGASEVKKTITGASMVVYLRFTELVNQTIANGATSLAKVDPLPNGVASISLSGEIVAAGEEKEIIITITYTEGYTGPSEVKENVIGGSISIAPTFDELVTSTPDLVNGGTTLTQIDTLPEGVESVVISPTSVGKGVTQEVLATVTYTTGYTGPTTIQHDVLGQQIQITDQQITDAVTATGNEGSGTLTFNNPTGATISVDNNGSLSNNYVVTLVISYDTGYTGPAIVPYTVLGLTTPDVQITDQQITDAVTATGNQGSGTLTFNNPTGATISVDNNGSLSNGDVTLNVVYTTGYTGSTTVTYTVSGLTISDVVITDQQITDSVTLTGNQGSGTITFNNPTGATISIDDRNSHIKNGSLINDYVVILLVTYDAGYTGSTIITYLVSGLTIQITDQQITNAVTVTGSEGSGTLTFNNPTGATISVDNNGSLSNGDVTLNVAYETGYTGPDTVTYTIAGFTAPDIQITDQQITDAVTLTGNEGSGTLIFADLDGISIISVDNNGSLSNGNVVTLVIEYEPGYTGPDAVVYTIAGLTAPDVVITDQQITDAVTVTGSEGSGTLTFNNPTGATILTPNNGSFSNNDVVTLGISYYPGYTGSKIVEYTVTGLGAAN